MILIELEPIRVLEQFVTLEPVQFLKRFFTLEPIQFTEQLVTLEPILMPQDPFSILEPSSMNIGPYGFASTAQFEAAYAKYQLEHPPEAIFHTFTQVSPSTLWVIPHPLNFSPSVTITDLTGTVVITDIVYVTPNLIHSISMNAFSGYAHLS
jgi:hypothetical protein